MLISLHIKNIALISELSLEFSKGLNILSGETGAGKSIIIDSLNFVLGDRADKGLIRFGETTASVQAVFDCPKNEEISEILSQNGIEEDDFLIVRRTMSENGRSECRINGALINLSVLKKVVSLLVDIHLQHENQAILNESNHIKILDKYSKKLSKIKEQYLAAYGEYKRATQELRALSSKEERARKMDILEFQIAEIQKANIAEGEEEALIKERSKCYNAQKLINGLGSAITLLEGDSGFGAAPSVKSAIKELNTLSQYDESYEKLAERLESTKIELEDIIYSLKDELENSSFDTTKLESIEKRIDEIRSIKRKYGATVEEIENFKAKAEEELFDLQNSAQKEEELAATAEFELNKAVKFAKEMHDIRAEDAIGFEKAIESNLADLGMQGSVFKVEITYPEGDIPGYLTENGADDVKFLISPNKGEPLKPLAKIASGGETSRLMLGLKNITAELEGIDTLVFDEIDTGISGRIAKVVACKLYNIAKTRQVLAVTHLPQLAAMADTHYLISKRVEGEKTLTFVEPLSPQSSITEIMRLAGSLESSESGQENARELKEWANNYKKSLE